MPVPSPAPGQSNSPGYKPYFDSGPYLRIFSNFGYSSVRGEVFLPCHVGKFTSRNGKAEAGYIYFGGWGMGAGGSAVDAGLQYSQTNDDYAGFIRDDRGNSSSFSQRFACNHWVKYQFLARTTTMLELDITDETQGVANQPPATIAVSADEGWSPEGAGPLGAITVKRMISIGQPSTFFARAPAKGDPGYVADGSYFGHAQNNKTPLIQFRACQFGKYDDRQQMWAFDPCSRQMQAEDGLPLAPGNTLISSAPADPDADSEAIDLSP